MLTDSVHQVATLKICGRDLKIKCTIQELPNLKKAAQYVEQKMQVLRNHTNTRNNAISLDIIAISAALNLACELMSSKKDQYVAEQVHPFIQTYLDKVEKVLKTS